MKLRTSVFLFPLLLCAVLISTGLAHAEQSYRCNGSVQRYPCDYKHSYDRRRNSRINFDVPATFNHQARFQYKSKSASKQFARVTTQAFRRVSNQQGLWKGKVLGNGKVHLHLNIFRDGTLESRRYMGNVRLSPRDREVPFIFRSPLPRPGKWSWKIVVHVV